MPKPKWITTSTAAQTSGIPKRTIIAAINRGDLRADKLPGLTGSFLINPRDLHTWLTSRPTRATSRPLELPTPPGLADTGARAATPPAGAGPATTPGARAATSSISGRRATK